MYHVLSITLLLLIHISLSNSRVWCDSILTEWNPIIIEATIKDTPQPTIGTRTMMIVFTSAYEAWQAYDQKALGTVVGDSLDGTGGPPTKAHKEEAISHAIYTTLLAVAPTNRDQFDAFMLSKGYVPGIQTRPAILGHYAAQAVLQSRVQDGSNAENGYTDTTGYQPRDPSMADAWQPLRIPLDNPNGTLQKPLTPHWGQVKPFAVTDLDGLRLPPPARPGTPEWDAQIQQLIDLSAQLTDREKVIAEYWRPQRGTPPMLWGTLAEFVSHKYKYTVDEDVKLYFTLHNAMFDASICCWENKYHYDYVRPVTAIRNLGDIPIWAWGGPGKGAMTILASQWQPYQELNQPTPPFPEYASGHSTFGSAWAEVMKLFNGSDIFQAGVTIDTLAFEGTPLNPPITLYWETFSDAAKEAGISRLYGGIHFMDGNLNAQSQGRKIGAQVFEKAQSLFMGGRSHLVTGGGWILSPAGAYRPDPNLSGKAHVGFVVQSQKNTAVPTGKTEFNFNAGKFHFHSSSYEWLVVEESKVQYQGSGVINGQGEYHFLVTAEDGQALGGDGVDNLHIKIWNKGTEVVVYDNKPGAIDYGNKTTELNGGNIMIHTE